MRSERLPGCVSDQPITILSTMPENGCKVVAALAAETKLMDVVCGSVMPVRLSGCGEGGQGASIRTVGEFAGQPNSS